jgi:hypothetical protein
VRVPRSHQTVLAACAASVLILSAGPIGCGGDDGDSGESDVLTSEGFERALDSVKDEAGEDAEALRIELGPTGAQFQLVEDGEGRGFFWAGGELQPVELQIVGSPSLGSSLFALSDVDPGAVDAIADGIGEEMDADDVAPATMTLQMHIGGEPGWTAHAEADGRRGLVFEAEADGSGVEQVSGLPGSDSFVPGG